MICILLIYRGLFRDAKECLNYFGQRRTDTVISQQFQVITLQYPTNFNITTKSLLIAKQLRWIIHWTWKSLMLFLYFRELKLQVRYATLLIMKSYLLCPAHIPMLYPLKLKVLIFQVTTKCWLEYPNTTTLLIRRNFHILSF